MLKIASAKVPFAQLDLADAKSLPYKDDLFDIIACNFAFHHFDNKQKCLDEMRRVLKVDGLLLMQNISPENIPDWWIYHYFPSTRVIDHDRFWTEGRLLSELGGLHFTATVELESMKETKLADLILEAENREVSQLTLIEESEYQDGLSRMRADRERSPTYQGATAIARRVCKKIA